MAAANIESFNILVGEIFARLYKEFPVPMELSVMNFHEHILISDASDELNDDQKNHDEALFFTSTVIWLADHGYISRGPTLGSKAIMDCSLTATTLELLNAIPKSLDGSRPSLGDELVKATKEGVTGKVKDLAGEFLSKALVFGTKAATDWTTT